MDDIGAAAVLTRATDFSAISLLKSPWNHAAIGTACVKGPGYKIPRGSALKKLVARFDPDPDEDIGTTATTPPDADSSSSGEEE